MVKRYAVTLLFTSVLSFPALPSHSQQITEVITDFNGFWQSGNPVNAIKPNNSHNLVAFKYRNTFYSTGIDSSGLISNNISYVGGIYKSLPVVSTANPVNSTYIGLASKYDGVENGPSNPPPVNNMPMYLTDGANGLNIGTGIYNLPQSDLRFRVGNFNASKIGDSIPDIILTQMGDINATDIDTLFFSDINGNVVGNKIAVKFAAVYVVGYGLYDFYKANTNPMVIESGSQYTNASRALRMLAFDLVSFGLNSSNIGSIYYYTQKVSGASDPAFIGAYNTTAFSPDPTILPVVLENLTITPQGCNTLLQWKTATEANSSYFNVEHSTTGSTYETVATVRSRNNVQGAGYQFLLANPSKGAQFFRLKMVDKDGSFKYSAVVSAAATCISSKITLQSNVVQQELTVRNLPATSTLLVIDLNGRILLKKKATSTNASIDLQRMAPGIYALKIVGAGVDESTYKFVKTP